MAHILNRNTTDDVICEKVENAPEKCAEASKNPYEQISSLVLKVKKRDKGSDLAFEQIVRICEKSVFELAYSIVRNTEDAMDISQETFVKLWRLFSDGCTDNIKSWYSYIMIITRNLALDFLRRQRIRRSDSITVSGEDGDLRDIDLPDTDIASDPVRAYERKERILAVREAIASLDEEYREILTLRDIEGLSYAEIAEIIGIEMGTVKSRIFRARRQVKDFLCERNFF